jgi:hypothetical protein
MARKFSCLNRKKIITFPSLLLLLLLLVAEESNAIDDEL